MRAPAILTMSLLLFWTSAAHDAAVDLLLKSASGQVRLAPGADRGAKQGTATEVLRDLLQSGTRR